MTTSTDTHGGGVEAAREALDRLIKEYEGADYDSGPSQEAWDFAYAALAASPAAPAAGEAQFTALRVAYKRGVAWAIENPGANSSLVEKAAYDYADKATSVALIDEHLTPGFSDVGDCCAGKLAATPPDAKER